MPKNHRKSRRTALKSREQPTINNKTKLQMKFIAYKEEKSPALAPPRPTDLKGITLSDPLHELSGELCRPSL